jgi:hypothetical protein
MIYDPFGLAPGLLRIEQKLLVSVLKLRSSATPSAVGLDVQGSSRCDWHRRPVYVPVQGRAGATSERWRPAVRNGRPKLGLRLQVKVYAVPPERPIPFRIDRPNPVWLHTTHYARTRKRPSHSATA